MLDPNSDDQVLLADARSLFEAALEHEDEAQDRWHEDSRMYHNTRGVGQWDSADLDYLRRMNRPALTFNMIGTKVRTFIGLHGDAKRTAQAVASGDKNRFLAEILNAGLEVIRENGCHEQAERDLMEFGAVMGASAMALHVERDPMNPTFQDLKYQAIYPFEQAWDPGPLKAHGYKHFFWHRWLDKSEFITEFPEHEKDYEELKSLSVNDQDMDSWRAEHVNDATDPYLGGREGDYAGKSIDLYYDREKSRIRLVECQYSVAVQKYWQVDPVSGESEEISEAAARRMTVMQAQGLVPGMEILSAWQTEVYELLFIGSKILEKRVESERMVPGFTNVRYCFYFDWEDGTPYGLVRNLSDPQREVNKQMSLSRELIAAQGMPGTIAEEDAVEDPELFEQQVKRSGGLAIVKSGAISQQKLMDRKTPQLSPAVSERTQHTVEAFHEISGIDKEAITPAGHAEAAATVKLRYHRSKLQHDDPIRAYERVQVEVARKELAFITKLSDAQIAAILDDSDRFRVVDGMVAEIETNSETDEIRLTGRSANLSDVKQLKYKVGLEVATGNTTLRLLELQQFLEAMQQGAPVAPEMIADRLAQNRADRETLKRYAEKQERAQAAARAVDEQKERVAAAQQERQMAQLLQLEQGKQAETSRHNMVTEALTAQDHLQDYKAKLANVWERADEAEKAQLYGLLTELVRQEAANNQGAANGE